ncbi:hypothetical protein [Nocardia sp. NBC_00403]|uniref:hypothetical protein n=1 Tax=Nocardia sp. NBC_00403 TaxID=2975990 RepID=UPI002E21EB4E
MRAARIRQQHTVGQLPDPAVGACGKHLHQPQFRQTGEIDRIRPGEECRDQDFGQLGACGERPARLEAQWADAGYLREHPDSILIWHEDSDRHAVHTNCGLWCATGRCVSRAHLAEGYSAGRR